MDRTKEEILEQINGIIDEYVQPAVQQHGGFIPGIRPGKKTADYICLLYTSPSPRD